MKGDLERLISTDLSTADWILFGHLESAATSRGAHHYEDYGKSLIDIMSMLV